ncbi:hypothetical protein WME91_43425 [Sorangium sp. So ce269]
MRLDPPDLGFAKATEPLRVLVDRAQGVGSLVQPEVQVGDLPGELVDVRVCEPFELVRK